MWNVGHGAGKEDEEGVEEGNEALFAIGWRR